MRHIFRRKKSGAKRADSKLAVNQVMRARKAKRVPTPSQLRHLPKLLNKTEKRIAGLALAAVLIAGVFLVIRVGLGPQVNVPAVGGEYTEGLIGTPQLINPLYATTSDVDTDLTRLIYSGLMRYDTTDGLVPDLAESFEISEDNKTYTFTVRDDAYWHDGEKVRATDIVFTINAIQTQEYRSPLEVSFASVTVEQVDERTVRFILDEPFAPFLSLLTVGILPSHLWEGIAPLNAPATELNRKPIGSGPYKFEKLVKDSKGNIKTYTFVRNPRYYDGAPYIEELHFKFYPETTSALEALRNKNIEGVSYVPIESAADFEKESGLEVVYPSLGQYVAAFFNEDKQPLLDELLIREALALGTDKVQLIEAALNGHGSPIKSFILDGMVGYHPDINVQVYNPTAAREKLEEIEWVIDEETQIRTKDETQLAFELVTMDTPELTATADELARQWSELGIVVNIRTVNQTDFQNDVLKNRNYDILLSGELYGIDPDPYAFWHSSQINSPGLNLAQYSNRQADEYIETGRSTTDPAARAEAYQALQELVTEDIAAVFLYQPTYSYAISKKIRNVEIDRMVVPADRFSQINQWYIKTRREAGRVDNE